MFELGTRKCKHELWCTRESSIKPASHTGLRSTGFHGATYWLLHGTKFGSGCFTYLGLLLRGEPRAEVRWAPAAAPVRGSRGGGLRASGCTGDAGKRERGGPAGKRGMVAVGCGGGGAIRGGAGAGERGDLGGERGEEIGDREDGEIWVGVATEIGEQGGRDGKGERVLGSGLGFSVQGRVLLPWLGLVGIPNYSNREPYHTVKPRFGSFGFR